MVPGNLSSQLERLSTGQTHFAKVAGLVSKVCVVFGEPEQAHPPAL